MAPLLRIYARYVIGIAAGVLVSKAVIPQELADALQSEPAVTAIASGFTAGAAFVVERFYAIAKQRGWTL